MLEVWGDYFIDEKCFEDVVIMYFCCFNFEKVLKVYCESGDWSGVFRVGALMKLGKDEILKLVYELCEEVNVFGKFGEVVKIVLEYCGDISGGVNFFINVREWEEVLRVVFMYIEDGLVLVVKSFVFECVNGLVSEFKELIEKVGKYLIWYLVVR